MAAYSLGVDIIEIRRIERALERHGRRFLERVYTLEEVAFCRGRVSELAARFAAKEAAMKALGTGARGVGFREIEVLPNQRGKPLVYLYGRAEERARELGLGHLEVSMSHSQDYALACIVAARDGAPENLQESRRRLLAWMRERGML